MVLGDPEPSAVRIGVQRWSESLSCSREGIIWVGTRVEDGWRRGEATIRGVRAGERPDVRDEDGWRLDASGQQTASK